jgi:glyoxylase-like metal-dependent hydrolase (beta-lactamase superfamily II)
VDPLEYDDLRAVAAGVVLIKAPGHSPGSQMIYVQRADGREFLFVGDIGWSRRNIEEVRPRARAISQFMLGEDRDAVFGQLAGIRDLHIAEPAIVIVPGHDAAVIEGLVADQTMIEGFTVPASP